MDSLKVPKARPGPLGPETDLKAPEPPMGQKPVETDYSRDSAPAEIAPWPQYRPTEPPTQQ